MGIKNFFTTKDTIPLASYRDSNDASGTKYTKGKKSFD
jgi:hypothetical protein